MSKRKYKVGDVVLIPYNEDDPVDFNPEVATIVRVNGAGYNLKINPSYDDGEIEHYRTARQIIRKLTKLEKAMR